MAGTLNILLLGSADGPGPAGQIEEAGAAVAKAATAEDAVRRIAAGDIDLAVVDLGNVADAAAACERIRAAPGVEVPIVVVASRIAEGDAEALRLAGADVVVRGLGERHLLVALLAQLAGLAKRSRTLAEEVSQLNRELNDFRRFTEELVAALPSYLFVVDHETNILFANRTALKGAGLEPLEAVGSPLSAFLRAAEEDGPLAATIRAVLADGEPAKIVGLHLSPGDRVHGRGEKRVVNADVRPCRLAGLLCARVELDDVTEEWKAESGRLRESRKLEDIVHATGAGLAALDSRLGITWANRAFVDWFGPGRALADVFGPGASADMDRAARRALVEGTAEVDGWRWYTRGGEPRTSKCSFARVSEPGGPDSLIVLVQDVTTHSEHIEQLQMAQHLNRVIQGVRDLDELLHLALTCVTTGQALGFNRAFLFLRNRKTDTLDGRMAVGPGSAEEAYRVWGELAARQSSLEDALRDASRIEPETLPLFKVIADLQYPLHDTRELPVRVFHEGRTILVRDAWSDERLTPEFRLRFGATELVAGPLVSKGQSLGVIVADNLYNKRPIGRREFALLEMLASSIGLAIENAEAFADLRESLDTLKRTRRQLVDQTKLAAVGRVAAHIAHEIRNPLATMGGFAHAITTRPDNPERVRDNSRIIYEEVRRLEHMLSGIMDFSRPTRPVAVVQPLNPVVERAARVLSQEFAPRVRIDTELGDGIPDFPFDAGQIEQVIINLGRNAAEAMTATGRVLMRTARNATGVSLTVEDDGPGIPAEVQTRVFEPFFTTRKGGTGLGLAVCRHIIAEHGGEVHLASPPGGGTVFTVSLPLRPMSPGELEQEDLL